MLQTSAVTAVGLAEGSSHVHWRKFRQILGWWFAGFFLVLGFSAALAAQGLYADLYKTVPTHTMTEGAIRHHAFVAA